MDTDWKATRAKLYKKIDEFNAWLAAKAAEAEPFAQEIKDLTVLMFKQMWADGGQYWNIIKEFFAWIGRIINWKDWKWAYCGVGLVLFGLILHYVFGV